MTPHDQRSTPPRPDAPGVPVPVLCARPRRGDHRAAASVAVAGGAPDRASHRARSGGDGVGMDRTAPHERPAVAGVRGRVDRRLRRARGSVFVAITDLPGPASNPGVAPPMPLAVVFFAILAINVPSLFVAFGLVLFGMRNMRQNGEFTYGRHSLELRPALDIHQTSCGQGADPVGCPQAPFGRRRAMGDSGRRRSAVRAPRWRDRNSGTGTLRLFAWRFLFVLGSQSQRSNLQGSGAGHYTLTAESIHVGWCTA